MLAFFFACFLLADRKVNRWSMIHFQSTFETLQTWRHIFEKECTITVNEREMRPDKLLAARTKLDWSSSSLQLGHLFACTYRFLVGPKQPNMKEKKTHIPAHQQLLRCCLRELHPLTAFNYIRPRSPHFSKRQLKFVSLFQNQIAFYSRCESVYEGCRRLHNHRSTFLQKSLHLRRQHVRIFFFVYSTYEFIQQVNCMSFNRWAPWQNTPISRRKKETVQWSGTLPFVIPNRAIEFRISINRDQFCNWFKYSHISFFFFLFSNRTLKNQRVSSFWMMRT